MFFAESSLLARGVYAKAGVFDFGRVKGTSRVIIASFNIAFHAF